MTESPRNLVFSMRPTKVPANPLDRIAESHDRVTPARAEMPYIQLLLEGPSTKRCYFIFFI